MFAVCLFWACSVGTSRMFWNVMLSWVHKSCVCAVYSASCVYSLWLWVTPIVLIQNPSYMGWLDKMQVWPASRSEGSLGMSVVYIGCPTAQHCMHDEKIVSDMSLYELSLVWTLTHIQYWKLTVADNYGGPTTCLAEVQFFGVGKHYLCDSYIMSCGIHVT